MKNFVQTGDTITLVAPRNLAAGEACLVGAIVGIATSAALSGAAVETLLVGVVDVSKLSAQAWTVGALIYWDDTAHLFTSVSTSNTLAGVAIAAAANPSAIGRVRLRGAFG